VFSAHSGRLYRLMQSIVRARLALLALAIAVLPPTLAVAANAPSVYTVSKVKVTAEAGDAVAAKEKALADAQQIALRELFKRITARASHARLPVLDDSMVERMVNGFAVRRESNSATRYIATLDFTFEPAAVRDILNRFGLAYTDQQAPQAMLIPFMIEAGAERAGSGNPWFEAFTAIDMDNALTPIKLSPARANLTAAMVADLSSASSRSLFETLAYQYRSENLVLAIAEVDAQATQLHLRLVGRDAVGGFAIDRKFRIFDRDIDYTAGIAAQIVAKTIEGRWKLTRLASQGALQGSADLETVSLVAQFSGLKAWQQMRARLQKVPGLQNLDVRGLNARGANLTIDFPGGIERLTKAAQSQGLAVEQQGGQWVLVAR
jgi:hypothetical protein